MSEIVLKEKLTEFVRKARKPVYRKAERYRLTYNNSNSMPQKLRLQKRMQKNMGCCLITSVKDNVDLYVKQRKNSFFVLQIQCTGVQGALIIR